MNLRGRARSAASIKSHDVPRLIGGACRRIAAYVLRLPRLTLKAGCKAGCRAGSPRDGRADRCKNQNSSNSKFQKLKNRKIKISKTFIAIFSTRSIAKLFPARSHSCSQDQRRDFDLFASLLLVLRSQSARCRLNASKQCPYEATTSTRLNSHVVRSEPRRTQ